MRPDAGEAAPGLDVTDGTGITYAWDFGDGTTGAGAAVTHTYGAAGTFTARVYATNSVPGAYIAITEVTVKAPAPAPPVENDVYLPIIGRTQELHGTETR